MYEAFVLYSFYQLMLQFLGGHQKLAARLVATGRTRSKCIPGCCCFRPWRMGSRFVHRCTVGVYQYVLLKIICSLLTIFTELGHALHEGSWSPKYAYVWLIVIVNLSQIYALTVLALFYVNTKEWLAPLAPLYKFGIIKLIIFVLFWQAVAISIAGMLHFVTPLWGFHDVETTAAGLQDFIVTIEVFVFAILHHYFFAYNDFFSVRRPAMRAGGRRSSAPVNRPPPSLPRLRPTTLSSRRSCGCSWRPTPLTASRRPRPPPPPPRPGC